MFQIITTVGPSLLTEKNIKKISQYKNCIYRINGAHVNKKQAIDIIKTIRKYDNNAKIMLDLPGNKIRTANLFDPIRIQKEEEFILSPNNITYPELYKFLNKGDVIFANDSLFKFEVKSISENGDLTFVSYSDGLLISGKGLHLPGIYRNLPFFFQKDLELISVLDEEEYEFLSLSFVRSIEDIQEAKKQISLYSTKNPEIFAKIETEMAIQNLESILQSVDYVNMDRGDLASDIGIHKVLYEQDRMIELAIKYKKNVYAATQFLKSMEKNSVPTMSEIDCLHRIIRKGVNGIQLSEETAIGEYPFLCIDVVQEIYNSINTK